MMVELGGEEGRKFLKRKGKLYYMTSGLNNEESYSFSILYRAIAVAVFESVLVSKHD